MSFTKNSLIAMVAGFFISIASTNAVAETIAVVDIQKVVSQLPQMTAVQQKLSDEFSVPTEEMKKLESDIKFKMEKFQRESMTMSQEQQTALRNEIQQMQQAFQTKAQPLQENIRRRQTEERNKILALVKQAIDAVASEEKIQLVLQSTAVAYVTSEKDISDKVAARVAKLK